MSILVTTTVGQTQFSFSKLDNSDQTLMTISREDDDTFEDIDEWVSDNDLRHFMKMIGFVCDQTEA